MLRSVKKINAIESRIGVASGTLGLVVSTLLVKVIGAVYKIPLYRLLGAQGVGLYQMVFPVYALLLTFAGGGVSTAITRLIADGYNGDDLLKKCLLTFGSAGFIFTISLALFSRQISILQGNELASSLYFAVSPSVFLVAVIGCVRGYFQGKSTFIPTAISQVMEQAVKAVSALIALYFTDGSIVFKGIIACLAITVSEIVALFYLLVKLKKVKRESDDFGKNEKLMGYGYLIRFIMPITLSAIILPIASFLDSFIAINALKQVFFENTCFFYCIAARTASTAL
jgi:stage V sporulation protein B